MFPILQRTPSQTTYHAVALEELEGILNRSRLLKDQAMTLQDEQRHLLSILERQIANVKLARCDETDRADLLAIGSAALELLSAIHVMVDEDAGMDSSQIEAKNNLQEKLDELSNEFENIKVSYDIGKMDYFILRLQTYLNAALPEPTGPIDERFQSLILGCNRDTQRFFRRRIQDFYNQCSTVQEEYHNLAPEELQLRQQSVKTVRNHYGKHANNNGTTDNGASNSSSSGTPPTETSPQYRNGNVENSNIPSTHYRHRTTQQHRTTNTGSDNDKYRPAAVSSRSTGSSPTTDSPKVSTTGSSSSSSSMNNPNTSSSRRTTTKNSNHKKSTKNYTILNTNRSSAPPDLWEAIPSSLRGLWDTAANNLNYNTHESSTDDYNNNDEKNEDNEEEEDYRHQRQQQQRNAPNTNHRSTKPSSVQSTYPPSSSSSASNNPYGNPLTSLFFGTTANTTNHNPSFSSTNTRQQHQRRRRSVPHDDNDDTPYQRSNYGDPINSKFDSRSSHPTQRKPTTTKKEEEEDKHHRPHNKRSTVGTDGSDPLDPYRALFGGNSGGWPWT